jgi:glutathione S-transferase
MVTLCGFRLSNYHTKLRIVLLEKGIEHAEEAQHFPSQEPAFRERSPMGKAPFLETPHGTLCESAIICEYLEDAYPAVPLLPRDPFARAKTREFLQVLELHLELVARRLYPEALFGRKVSDETKQEVTRDLEKGMRALVQLAKFAPYAVGADFSLADCAMACHVSTITMATRSVLGRDYFDAMPQLPEYLQRLEQRPAIKQALADRRAAQAAAIAARNAAK